MTAWLKIECSVNLIGKHSKHIQNKNNLRTKSILRVKQKHTSLHLFGSVIGGQKLYQYFLVLVSTSLSFSVPSVKCISKYQSFSVISKCIST